MELFDQENNVSSPIKDINPQTESNTYKSSTENESNLIMEGTDKVLVEERSRETDISESVTVNDVPEECTFDHIDTANNVPEECIPNYADTTNYLPEECVPDFADATNNITEEYGPDLADTTNNITEEYVSDLADATNNITEEYVPDHTDIAQTDVSDECKGGNSNENIEMDAEIEVTYDSTSDNNNFKIEYNFKDLPYQITGSWKEFSSTTRNNFTRGCKWAPDGSCILTCSDDNSLRIFNLPHQLWDSSQWHDIAEMEAVVKITEGELIYDYCWYPLMNSSDASTCCLASASRNSTVHLWDGFTGELRCSYRTYNHMDEIVTPHSLSFDVDGQKLFCGFEKVVRVFNVDTPGRMFEERYIFAKKSGQSGIVSCFAFTSADRNISAAGSYQKTIGIYSEPSGNLECLLEGQKGGITQLQFSPDGLLLYSGGRKDPEILCWDLRNLGSVLFSLRRSCHTNQRMYFDISRCGKYIVSGNHNGVITIWDITKEPKIINEEEFSILEPIQFYLAHEDCVNGISLHPTYPLLCSSSGQRKFPVLLSEDDDDIFSPKIDKWDNSLRLWWLGNLN